MLPARSNLAPVPDGASSDGGASASECATKASVAVDAEHHCPPFVGGEAADSVAACAAAFDQEHGGLEGALRSGALPPH